MSKYEDLAMKTAMRVFSESALSFFGIHQKVKEIAPTELVSLNIKNLSMDYTFLMEDDRYIHLEFQSTENKWKADLRRFRCYEALLSHQTQKTVVTYVIYSGKVKKARNCFEEGINKYNVVSISMKDYNGDKIMEDITNKIENKEPLTKEELVQLTLTPLMRGTQSSKDCIIKATQLVHNTDTQYKPDILALLFAFANKFLDSEDLNDVKGVIGMTELGQMLREDGIKEGMEKGIELGALEKKLEIACKMLQKGLDDDMILEFTTLSKRELDKLKQQ